MVEDSTADAAAFDTRIKHYYACMRECGDGFGLIFILMLCLLNEKAHLVDGRFNILLLDHFIERMLTRKYV